jgi:ribonuclease HII
LSKYVQVAIVGVGVASVEEIDTLNILRASHLAMQRAFHALSESPIAAIVDGNMAPDLGATAFRSSSVRLSKRASTGRTEKAN